VQRPEIDAERIGVHSVSFGSFWGLRFPAHDRRIRAIAAPAATCCAKYFLMDLQSPRWKQLFAYLTQSATEAELDAVMAVGEYDPRGPLDEAYRLFDQMTAPAELWVFADQHHMPAIGGGDSAASWAVPLHAVMCDWLRDRLAGKPLRHPGQVVYVEPSGAGPNSAEAALKRWWYETPQGDWHRTAAPAAASPRRKGAASGTAYAGGHHLVLSIHGWSAPESTRHAPVAADRATRR
jgi:hypothetical protein